MKTILIGFFMLTFAGPAVAQQATTVSCSAFIHHANGSWSPKVPVKVGAVTMGPGVSFSEGVQFGGVDLAHKLNQQCSH